MRPLQDLVLKTPAMWSGDAEAISRAPIVTAGDPSLARSGRGAGMACGRCPHMKVDRHTEPTRVGSTSVGRSTPTPAPLTQARSTFSSSHLQGDWKGMPWAALVSQGPRAGSPPLPPPHGRVSMGRSQSAAAQSGPLAARRIAAPPRPIQPAAGAQFPPAQSAPGPAPPARGSQPTHPHTGPSRLPSTPTPTARGTAHPPGALSWAGL